MFLVHDGEPSLDYDFWTLEEIASVIDDRLDTLERGEHESDWGDAAEGLCGVGFVACQQYVVATASWLKVDKGTALSAGPLHACRQTTVSIVNHAANYWKHGDPKGDSRY